MADRNILQNNQTEPENKEVFWNDEKCSNDSDLDSIDNSSDAAISEDVIFRWMDSLFAYEIASINPDDQKRSLEYSE